MDGENNIRTPAAVSGWQNAPDRQEPESLLLVIDSENRLKHSETRPATGQAFSDFVGDRADPYLDRGVMPDDWLIHYKMPDKGMALEYQSGSKAAFLNRLTGDLKKKGIRQEIGIGLRDAVFCRNMGIPFEEFNRKQRIYMGSSHYEKFQEALDAGRYGKWNLYPDNDEYRLYGIFGAKAGRRILTAKDYREREKKEAASPADIFLKADCHGRTFCIVRAGELPFGNNDFGSYVYERAHYALKSESRPIEDAALLHYRFEDSSQLPPLWTKRDNNDYFGRVDRAAGEHGVIPVRVSLYDAIYCYRYGFDPLASENSHENLMERKGYREVCRDLCRTERREPMQIFTAVETDKGTLLFDNSEKGEKLKQEYIAFHADYFFDPRLEVSYLRTMNTFPLEDQKGKMNPDLSELHLDGYKPFGEIPMDCYADPDRLTLKMTDELMDLTPDLENFIRIAIGEDGDIPSMRPETYDVSTLLWLATDKPKSLEVNDEFPNYFSYHDHFDTFRDLLSYCKDQEAKNEILGQARDHARALLVRDYPDTRGLELTEQEKESLKNDRSRGMKM